VQDTAAVTVFLFTDIEGSTRLWEQAPDRMHEALAKHDAIARESVAANRGRVVKTTGDGVHAVFADPLDALRATVALQLALANPAATAGMALKVRCGIHAGVEARRDNDFFGNAVNRAARLMSAAHGGQILVSQTVAALVRDRLNGMTLRELGAVRLRDLSQPEHVFQLVHPGLRVEFPALRSLEATPNNLPQQLTSFIGREHELAEVQRQLRQTRLLTVVGVGGLGKSRLSLQVAADVLDEFADGVWFVELAPLADARLVPQSIASVLGVMEETGRPVIEALLKFVRDRRLLIVLDNCEHLTGTCADIARKLLESGPHLTILASSRERLNIAGEKAYPLAPFPVPIPAQQLPPEALAAFASVRLFAERAAAARPEFAITADNAAAVAEICHRLDGIPLALELAAARTRAMSVDRIAERLGDRFRLLGGGDRTALPRQQTLRALIDWSFDLLDEDEKTLFRRLAVFAGGFTLEAAEAVGSAGNLATPDVLHWLTRLVEKSLVVLDLASDRYRMLETVRQYAQERLDESNERDETRNRHLAHFLAFAESAAPELLGPSQGAWMRKLDLDRENLLAAHHWCDHAEGDGERGLRLVRSIQVYWFTRGLLGLGLQLALEALARPGAQAHNFIRCRGLAGAGQLALYMGKYAEARHYLEESLAIAREIRDASRVAAVLQPLGMAALGEGDLATARERLQEAVMLANTGGNKREIAAALSAQAQLRRAEGALDDAQSLNERALALSRAQGDQESIVIALLNLAMVAIGRGTAVPARDMLLQAMAIAEAHGSKPGGQCAIDVSAALAAMVAQWSQAARLFGAGEGQAAQTQIHRDPADEMFLAPLIAKVREALGAEAFNRAERDGKALPFESALAEARAWLERSF
jgi:predicted ATPase/class 3 adenylate cyclase